MNTNKAHAIKKQTHLGNGRKSCVCLPLEGIQHANKRMYVDMCAQANLFMFFLLELSLQPSKRIKPSNS